MSYEINSSTQHDDGAIQPFCRHHLAETLIVASPILFVVHVFSVMSEACLHYVTLTKNFLHCFTIVS